MPGHTANYGREEGALLMPEKALACLGLQSQPEAKHVSESGFRPTPTSPVAVSGCQIGYEPEVPRSPTLAQDRGGATYFCTCSPPGHGRRNSRGDSHAHTCRTGGYLLGG